MGGEFLVSGEWPFCNGRLRPPENTDIHIIIHNSNKITSYEIEMQIIFGWGHPNMINCFKES